MDYFQVSQNVKREIEEDSELVKKIIEGCPTGKGLEIIDEGSHNITYRIGQLKSGTWLASRIHKEWARLGKVMLAVSYNSFCEEAQEMSSKGQKVPGFSIGAISIYGWPILLVEDLTEGGLWEVGEIFKIGQHDRAGYRMKSGVKEKIWFDLGMDNVGLNQYYDAVKSGKITIDTLKYFHPEARIEIIMPQIPSD